ncbi:hypothetical protein NC653_041719 [Populus alba x Populus x berolinensis]|uniref:Uncharacterized protein n=1 Tax=Populus alba x Populus x berolinensis TaxID=444605 RepID=A0AAD6L967_9ROSI|nr:hypothetical protein NC653_041719 [Populus alba x Populus x berolinensis]
MAVKIRLAKLGCLNKAFYRIVAADSHTPRDGKHLRVVGFYDTLADLDFEGLLGLFSGWMEAKNEMQAHIMKMGQNSKTFYQVAKLPKHVPILFFMLGQ